jgi:FkbM family methyltransferase
VDFLGKKNIYISRTPYKFYNSFIEYIELNLLENCFGVLHIGAHFGQELDKYQQFNLKVIWIEGNPKIFDRLSKNVRTADNQRVICALLGDRNAENVSFFETSNDGQSSSIYQTGSKLDLVIRNSATTFHKMVRLDSILSSNELLEHDHWVIDVQGAELLVLKGAGELIQNCKSLLIEVSRGDFYKNGSKFEDIFEFLREKGFKPILFPKDGFHGDAIFVRS